MRLMGRSNARIVHQITFAKMVCLLRPILLLLLLVVVVAVVVEEEDD